MKRIAIWAVAVAVAVLIGLTVWKFTTPEQVSPQAEGIQDMGGPSPLDMKRAAEAEAEAGGITAVETETPTEQAAPVNGSGE